MKLKKLIGQLHLWLGLASGLVVLIISITGCLYVFIEELRPLVYADRMYITARAGAKKLPVSLLKEKAQAALGAEHPISGMEVFNTQNNTYAFRSRKIDKKAIWYGNYYPYHLKAYLNPYTGEVVKVENTKWEFFTLVVYIHISLLLGHTVGSQIVAYSVLMFVLLLISGIVLWWPKNKNAAKQRFWFKWKENTQWKRKNYDLHNVLGFYAMSILLVISLTGLIWSFEWVGNSVQWVANGGKTIEKPKPIVSDTTQLAEQMPLDRIVASASLRFPTAENLFVSIPQDKKGTVGVFARFEGAANYRSIRNQYDQHTGQLLKTQQFADMNGGEKMRALNYDLHVGSVLGLPGKFLAFFASLISASLPITGFAIWWGKRNKKGSKKRGLPKSKSVKAVPSQQLQNS